MGREVQDNLCCLKSSHSSAFLSCYLLSKSRSNPAVKRDRPKAGDPFPKPMIEAFLANPYSVIGALLLAAFVGHIQWRNGYKVRRAAACATFRATIDRELLSLLSAWPQNIDKTLIARYTVLESAVREFRHYVPLLRRRRFDHAWFVYQYGSDGSDIGSHYYQY